MENKTYTQEEVNSIVEQVKARQQEKSAKKIETNYVEIAKYQELEKKINDYEFKEKTNEFKSKFILNGGNEQAFQDFIKTNGDILNLDNDNQVKQLEKLREEKPYFFNKQQQEIISKPLPNSESVVKELLDNANKSNERIEGTIYRKRF